MFDRFERILTELAGGVPESLLVALSGGSDSVCLLRLCVIFAAKHGTEVEAMHMNHGIRGEEADRDERFCKSLCQRYEIPCHTVRRDIPMLAAKRKEGLEECARTERYKALEACRKERDISFVLTAHNSDDQAETVLFRIGRGCALKGLCGIPEKRGAILRPLLRFSKEDITDFCEKEGLPFVEDSSNADLHYARNRIRKEVMPALKKACPAVLSGVETLSKTLREDEAFISSFVPTEKLDLTHLKALHPAILRRYIAARYEEYLSCEGKTAQIERVHLENICRKILSGKSGFSYSLPGCVKITVNGGGMHFLKDKEKTKAYCLKLCRGENRIPQTECSVYLGDAEAFQLFFEKNQKIHNLFMKVAFSSDKIKGDVYMRSRMPGDRIYFGGMTRQVSKLVAARENNPNKRKAYPVICDANGILWVPGYPVREGCSGCEDGKDATLYMWMGEQGHELS